MSKPKLSVVTEALLLLAITVFVVTIINMENRDTYITPKLTCNIDDGVCNG